MSINELYCWLRGNTPDGPPILYCADWQYKGMPSEELQQMPLIFICSFSKPMQGRHLDQQQRRLQTMFPKWQVFVGAPSPRLARESANTQVIPWSDALLTRTDFWTPTHDAVFYSAVTAVGWAPYNKHELLTEVSKVLVVAPLDVEFKMRENQLRKNLNANYFAAFRHTGWQDPEVARSFYTQAHCGLVISDFDCGSRMVSEFQLCGLPVVSTRSRVGALSYCDLEFVRIIPDSPGSLKDAVAEFESGGIDPHDVRFSYYENMMVGRAGFVARFGNIEWDNLPIMKPRAAPANWDMPV